MGTDRRQMLTVGGIFLLALVLRAIFILTAGHELLEINVDEGFYDRQAMRIVQGEGLGFPRYIWDLKAEEVAEDSPLRQWLREPGYAFGLVPCDRPTAFLSPGYPCFLAAIYGIFGHHYAVSRLAQAVLGALLVLPVFYLARSLFGELEALLAALAAALYPFFLYYTGILITETLYIVLLATGVLAAVQVSKGAGNLAAIACGVVFAATFHVRSGILLAMPLLWAGMLLAQPKQWRRVALTVIAFAVVVAPWVIRNAMVLGHPVLLPTNGAVNLWMRNHPEVVGPEMEEVGLGLRPDIGDHLRRKEALVMPDFGGADEVERSRMLRRQMVGFILANPRYFGSLCARRFIWLLDLSRMTRKYQLSWPMMLSAWLSYPPVLMLGALGMVLQRARWRALACGLAVVLLTGCASFSKDGGFGAVESVARERLGMEAKWVRSDKDADAVRQTVKVLLSAPLTPDAAVQAALLNNRGLQATYYELGIAEADLVQAGRLRNPGFVFERLSRGDIVDIERTFFFDIIGLLTMPVRTDLERRRFAIVQQRVAAELLQVATDTRRAYYRAVAAGEGARYMEQVKLAAEASAELARAVDDPAATTQSTGNRSLFNK